MTTPAPETTGSETAHPETPVPTPGSAPAHPEPPIPAPGSAPAHPEPPIPAPGSVPPPLHGTSERRPLSPWPARPWLTLLAIFLLALTVRAWDLGGSGLQTDEPLWHYRSARFVQSVLGPSAPAELLIPERSSMQKYVDLLSWGNNFPLSREYPFTIKIEAIHPGTPMSGLIGGSWFLFGTATSPWSWNLFPPEVAARLPGVLLGSLWVLLLYAGGRHLVGSRAAGCAALLMAVEPLLVGHSRLARIDLSAAFFASGAIFAYLAAQRGGRRPWTLVAGLFAGLALATNPYGLFLIPVFLLIRWLFAPQPLPAPRTEPTLVELAKEEPPPPPDITPSRRWRVPGFISRLDAPGFIRRLDRLLLGSWLLSFILAYPNLWPNPLTGLFRVAQRMATLPHLSGELSPEMPVSHLFYLLRSPEHVLPWTLGLAAVGLLLGMFGRHRETGFLFLWGAAVLLLLSLPAGRKSTKNFLLVMPPLLLLAGVGMDRLLAGVGRLSVQLERRAERGALVLLLVLGLGATGYWWPYPQLFTWPWQPDPQTQALRELAGVGEGVREALDHIRTQGPAGARVGCYSGRSNGSYHYDSKLLGQVANPDDLANFDWLMVLPKYYYATADTPLTRWARERQPDHVIRQNQIELVRLYRLSGPTTAAAPPPAPSGAEPPQPPHSAINGP